MAERAEGELKARPYPTEGYGSQMSNGNVMDELKTAEVLKDFMEDRQLSEAEYDNINLGILQNGTSIYKLCFLSRPFRYLH